MILCESGITYGMLKGHNDMDMNKIRERIREIAYNYGYESQSRQCIEEMAELTQAINKLWRANKNGQSTQKSEEECLDNLIEELADVQIMIWQLEYLIGCDIMPTLENKVNRTMEQMRNE